MPYKDFISLPLLFLDINRRKETQCASVAVKTLKFFLKCEDLSSDSGIFLNNLIPFNEKDINSVCLCSDCQTFLFNTHVNYVVYVVQGTVFFYV